VSNDSASGRSTEDPGAPGSPPVALKVAAVVLGVEGLAAVVLGVIEAFSTSSGRLAMGVTTALFLVAYGAGLGLVGYGLSRAATWSRGPAVFAQLIQLGVAWSFRGGSTTWVAVLLALAAVVALGAIFRKASTEALTDRPAG
jgi:hypothetical protein